MITPELVNNFKTHFFLSFLFTIFISMFSHVFSHTIQIPKRLKTYLARVLILMGFMKHSLMDIEVLLGGKAFWTFGALVNNLLLQMRLLVSFQISFLSIKEAYLGKEFGTLLAFKILSSVSLEMARERTLSSEGHRTVFTSILFE